jgi:tricorn protease
MTYLSQPALSATDLYFISEEDLWKVPLSNPESQAVRLTSGLGPIATPKLSPDGKWIAVSSEEEGHVEVYVMPAIGGELKRLTYFGAWSYPVAWKDENTILFKSNAKHAHRKQEFFQVSKTGGLPTPLSLGEGTNISFSSGEVVIERNLPRDASHWKRYRGGTMGQFWVSKSEKENFRKLEQLKGNVSCPVWVNDRIFFLSDETGLGRIYSCDSDGENKRIHGGDFYSDYYFRNLTTNQNLFAMQSAGDLFLYDPKSDLVTPLNIQVLSDHSKTKRKSISASTDFVNYSLQPQGEKILLESRGKILHFAHWSGPVTTIGTEANIRYKHADWLADGKRVVMVADDGLTESIEIYSDHSLKLKKISPPKDLKEGFGRITKLKTAPRTDEILFSNHRNELFFLELTTGNAKLIYQNQQQLMGSFVWSPDGKYVAFTRTHSHSASQIAVWEKDTGKTNLITEGTFQDYAPYFDPEGNYLYFLSKRIFNPIYDDVIFDMTFPKAGLPLFVILKKGVPSPLFQESTLPDTLAKAIPPTKEVKEITCEIDFDRIQERIFQFPVNEAKYTKIVGVGKKVLWSYLPVEGSVNLHMQPGVSPGKEYLDCFDFATGKFEYYGTGVTDFKVRHECGLRITRSGNQLRLTKATEKPEDLAGKDLMNPKFGVIDLSRANFMIEPRSEWKQMFNDAWRIQKEYYWRADLNGLDWDVIYKRYEPVIAKVNSRREFSDLIWEMIGELGTSHAYEVGGDYRGVPLYAVGSLGAEFTWNPKEFGYTVTKIYKGDSWSRDAFPPLLAPGVALEVGDVIIQIAGQALTECFTPYEASLNLSDRAVRIHFKSKGDPTIKEGMIKCLKNDQPLLYRNWVEEKRTLVKKLSGGKLGYIHIPNMVGLGYAEFHRNFMQEIECEGLIIDVRYNGGGHVSQLIMDRLARKPLGKSVSRWLGTQSIPFETPRKVAVAICNEFAGSDGDIFSHTFKMRKIGKLVGTRTWGGVVGIWPRNSMIDGGYTTQPEFSMWFNDVEYGIENHGAEPDVVVEYPPEAWKKGEDPQLNFAIAEAMKSL